MSKCDFPRRKVPGIQWARRGPEGQAWGPEALARTPATCSMRSWALGHSLASCRPPTLQLGHGRPWPSLPSRGYVTAHLPQPRGHWNGAGSQPVVLDFQVDFPQFWRVLTPRVLPVGSSLKVGRRLTSTPVLWAGGWCAGSWRRVCHLGCVTTTGPVLRAKDPPRLQETWLSVPCKLSLCQADGVKCVCF